MKQQIPFELSRIERENGVRVLYAAEAGVRAWGIASPDAGHDVRFLFTGTGTESRGVIEKLACKGLTLHGVDLQRALNLLLDSNTPLLEWLRSPIRYLETKPFSERFRFLAGRFFDAERSFAQYFRLAERIHTEHLREGNPGQGKYLAALRAALSARWLEQERVPPPVNFSTLVEKTVKDAGAKTMIQKVALREQRGKNASTDAISDFLTEELFHLEVTAPKKDGMEQPVPRRSVEMITYLHDAHLQEA